MTAARTIRLLLVLGLILLGLTPFPFKARASGSAFVQERDTRMVGTASVAVTLASPVVAGDGLVVDVIWDSTAAVTLSDSRGNAYRVAVGPLTWKGGTRKVAIFHAPTALAGATTITASFAPTPAGSELLYVHEYSGLGAVDGTSARAGTGNPLTSGAVNTTASGDLLFAAAVSDNNVATATAGYTARSMMNGNLTEDAVADSAGTYVATTTHNGTAWAIGLVAFASASSSPTATSSPSRTATVTGQPSATPTATGGVSATRTATSTAVPGATPAWPIMVSADGRSLVDQQHRPFLLVGDSPHDLVAKASVSDAAIYFADRQAHGFNAAVVYLLCGAGVGCNADRSTFDGIAPFTTAGDLATPNEAYFARADAMIRQAAQDGITVLLDPAETTDLLAVLQANGTTKDFAYGAWLGNRYKAFPNLIWYNGNDFQTWNNAGDRAVVQAVANGIKSTDPGHLQTAQLNYNVSDSWQDPSWLPIAALDGVYSYYPTYAQMLVAYNRQRGPVFLTEANYEGANNTGQDPPQPLIQRLQEYWTLLSGATGQVYGNAATRHQDPGWLAHLDTQGVTELGYHTRLFAARPWWTLVPDQAHTLVTAGYGTFAASGPLHTNDYLTAARTPDGALALAYLPSARTITVNLAALAGPVTAQWFDPTAGTFSPIAGSPFANSGSRQFTPPGANSGGDTDWVLVLTSGPTASPTNTTTATSTPTAIASATATATGTVKATSTATATSAPTRTSTPTVAPTPGAPAPVFVQEQDGKATTGTTVSVTLPNVGAGHLLLAYVIRDSSESIVFTDSRGDTFSPVAPGQGWNGTRMAQAFVAKGVAGGSTTVSVTFGTSLAHSGLLYLLEYAGANAGSPVDGQAEAAGTGSAMNSGNAVTTRATDRLVGLGVSSGGVTAGGPSYTVRSTFNGNITEDMATTSAGSYGATATQNSTAWAMQVVALRP